MPLTLPSHKLPQAVHLSTDRLVHRSRASGATEGRECLPVMQVASPNHHQLSHRPSEPTQTTRLHSRIYSHPSVNPCVCRYMLQESNDQTAYHLWQRSMMAFPTFDVRPAGAHKCADVGGGGLVHMLAVECGRLWFLHRTSQAQSSAVSKASDTPRFSFGLAQNDTHLPTVLPAFVADAVLVLQRARIVA